MTDDVSSLAEFSSYYQYVNPYQVENSIAFSGLHNFVSGEMDCLTDDKGEVWVDLVAHFGAATLGHNPPELLNAVQNYLGRNAIACQPFGINPKAGELASRLVSKSPIQNGRVVFGTTGMEAIEAAQKIALAATGKNQCLGFTGSFHGLSLGTLKMMGHTPWLAPLPNFEPVCPLDKDAPDTWLLRLQQESPAAVVLELVQGIGGGFSWTARNLAKLQSACADTGTLIIVDEVQTGLGRCGNWFMSNAFEDFSPDMIAVSKGLSGGLVPLSALIVKPEHHESLFGSPGCAQIHGSTFATNNMAIHNASAVLDILESKNVLGQVAITSTWLWKALAELQDRYPVIGNIEGQGLLVCITFVSEDPTLAAWMVQVFMDNFILVNLAAHRANTLKLTPALTVTKDSLQQFLDVFESILDYMKEDDNALATQ